MHFSSANEMSGRGDGRPAKKKQPYIPPKATMVTPDQAEEELKTKAVPLSQLEACAELVAEARKRQELGRDSVSRGGASSAVLP